MEPASSLQRAAAAVAASRSDAHTKGEFETCFASGLDLSEFGRVTSIAVVGGHYASSTSSHAAVLLQKKQAELIEKQKHAQQEARLLDAAQQRRRRSDNATEQLKSGTESASQRLPPRSITDVTRPRSDGAWISSLVVGMHSAEQSAEPRHKMMRGRSATKKHVRSNAATTTKSTNQGKHRPASAAGKQQHAARKARRTKY